MMKLKDKLALVTGASGGIGAALAHELATQGAKVILLARTKSKLDAVAETIRAAGGEAHVYPCDLCDPSAVAETAEHIKGELGVPDVIINNAGAGRWLSVEETDPQEAVSMMGAPYFAAFFTTRAFVTEMVKRGSGTIANLNSPMAYLVIPGATGYAACRCALRGFNDGLRSELHGTGVRVTHLVFGEVSSEYFEHNPGSQERIPSISKIMPVLSPEKTARLAVRAIESDRAELLRPLMLNIVVLLSRLMPGVTNWLMRVTGWKRAV